MVISVRGSIGYSISTWENMLSIIAVVGGLTFLYIGKKKTPDVIGRWENL